VLASESQSKLAAESQLKEEQLAVAPVIAEKGANQFIYVEHPRPKSTNLCMARLLSHAGKLAPSLSALIKGHYVSAL
jgi:hypothetical protein